MKSHEVAAIVGRLAENAAFEALGVREPTYEIKAAHWQANRVRLRSGQIQKDVENGKVYCIVFYSRPIRRVTIGGVKKRRVTLSPQEAFQMPLKFVFIRSHVLMDLINSGKCRSRAARGESWYDIGKHLILEKCACSIVWHEGIVKKRETYEAGFSISSYETPFRPKHDIVYGVERRYNTDCREQFRGHIVIYRVVYWFFRDEVFSKSSEWTEDYDVAWECSQALLSMNRKRFPRTRHVMNDWTYKYVKP